MKKITVEFLLEKPAACFKNQVEVFQVEFPDGMEVTRANIMRCVELGLDVEWFIRKKLPREAAEAYEKAIAPAEADIILKYWPLAAKPCEAD